MSPSIRTAVFATLALLAPAATARAQTIWDLYYESAAAAAPDGAAFDALFGFAVSLSADTLAVGVPCGGGTSCQGLVRVYTRSGSAWTLQQTLIDTGTIHVFEVFGRSVSLSGETLAVGVPGDWVGTNQA